jgi:hypothetical protein
VDGHVQKVDLVAYKARTLASVVVELDPRSSSQSL